MRIQFSLIQEQGVKFAIVVVQDSVVLNSFESNKVISQLTPYFGVPVVLLGANNHKTYGKESIVRFLSSVNVSMIQWKTADV